MASGEPVEMNWSHDLWECVYCPLAGVRTSLRTVCRIAASKALNQRLEEEGHRLWPYGIQIYLDYIIAPLRTKNKSKPKQTRKVRAPYGSLKQFLLETLSNEKTKHWI